MTMPVQLHLFSLFFFFFLQQHLNDEDAGTLEKFNICDKVSPASWNGVEVALVEIFVGM